MNTTRIIEEVGKDRFREIILKYKNSIKIGSHAFDHLNEAQRKVFNEDSLCNTILREKPHSIGLQRNGRYAVFYRRKEGYLRIILEIKESRIDVVTFINTDNIPHMKRLRK
jgi:mRNA-degrading endonuclease RelE of RelBE toxin-antitoxin system